LEIVFTMCGKPSFMPPSALYKTDKELILLL
jgi:hypothetical protein